MKPVFRIARFRQLSVALVALIALTGGIVWAVPSPTATAQEYSPRFFSGMIDGPEFCLSQSLGGVTTYAFDSDGNGVADTCSLDTTRLGAVARQNTLVDLARSNPDTFKDTVLAACSLLSSGYGNDSAAALANDACSTSQVSDPPAPVDPARAALFFSGPIDGPEFCLSQSLGGVTTYAFDSDSNGVADTCSLPFTRREAVARQNALETFLQNPQYRTVLTETCAELSTTDFGDSQTDLTTYPCVPPPPPPPPVPTPNPKAPKAQIWPANYNTPYNEPAFIELGALIRPGDGNYSDFDISTIVTEWSVVTDAWSTLEFEDVDHIHNLYEVKLNLPTDTAAITANPLLEIQVTATNLEGLSGTTSITFDLQNNCIIDTVALNNFTGCILPPPDVFFYSALYPAPTEAGAATIRLGAQTSRGYTQPTRSTIVTEWSVVTDAWSMLEFRDTGSSYNTHEVTLELPTNASAITANPLLEIQVTATNPDGLPDTISTVSITFDLQNNCFIDRQTNPAYTGCNVGEASIIASPASVPTAGRYTFTVTGSGWTGNSWSVLMCSDLNDLQGCEHSLTTTTSLEIYYTYDGSITTEITIDVPAEGISIIVSGTNMIFRADFEESASVFIPVTNTPNT